MRQEKPTIDAELLKIVRHEIKRFTGHFPLRNSECGTQAALIDDLVSAAHGALMKAVDGFDPSLGFKVKTYASKCVRNAIKRAARPRKSDVLGHELLRLDAPVSLDDELSDHHEVIADETADHEFQISEGVWRCLQKLMPPRELDVLLSRWSGDKHREIAQRLGVSKERTRQIEVRALQRAADLYRTHAELRAAINATLFQAAQMLDALAVVRAYRPLPTFWKYRDERRFLEARVRAKAKAKAEAEAEAAAGANLQPVDATDALVIAARLALLELKKDRKPKRSKANVHSTAGKRGLHSPARSQTAA